MKTIYKYDIIKDEETGIFFIEVPKGAEVISAAINQNTHEPLGYIYAIVDPTLTPTIKREVLWLGTGWPLGKEDQEKMDGYQFLGTFQDGWYVWHIWVEYEDIDLTSVFGKLFDLEPADGFV